MANGSTGALKAVAHVGRNPEIVTISDRDVISFTPDRLRGDILGSTIKIYDSNGGTLLYTLTGSVPEAPERVLLYGRISSSGVLENGLRLVPYIDNDDPEVDEIKVLREIISPRFLYDRTTNIISLWFWTNFKTPPPSGEYTDDPNYLLHINEHEFDIQSVAHRALCLAVGTLEHFYIEGGLVDGTGGTEDTHDLIPIFTKPKIVQIRDIKQGLTGPQGTNPTGLTGYIPILDFIPEVVADDLIIDSDPNLTGGKVYGPNNLTTDVYDEDGRRGWLHNLFLVREMKQEYFSSVDGVSGARMTFDIRPPSGETTSTARFTGGEGAHREHTKGGDVLAIRDANENYGPLDEDNPNIGRKGHLSSLTERESYIGSKSYVDIGYDEQNHDYPGLPYNPKAHVMSLSGPDGPIAIIAGEGLNADNINLEWDINVPAGSPTGPGTHPNAYAVLVPGDRADDETFRHLIGTLDNNQFNYWRMKMASQQDDYTILKDGSIREWNLGNSVRSWTTPYTDSGASGVPKHYVAMTKGQPPTTDLLNETLEETLGLWKMIRPDNTDFEITTGWYFHPLNDIAILEMWRNDSDYNASEYEEHILGAFKSEQHFFKLYNENTDGGNVNLARFSSALNEDSYELYRRQETSTGTITSWFKGELDDGIYSFKLVRERTGSDTISQFKVDLGSYPFLLIENDESADTKQIDIQVEENWVLQIQTEAGKGKLALFGFKDKAYFKIDEEDSEKAYIKFKDKDSFYWETADTPSISAPVLLENTDPGTIEGTVKCRGAMYYDGSNWRPYVSVPDSVTGPTGVIQSLSGLIDGGCDIEITGGGTLADPLVIDHEVLFFEEFESSGYAGYALTHVESRSDCANHANSFEYWYNVAQLDLKSFYYASPGLVWGAFPWIELGEMLKWTRIATGFDGGGQIEHIDTGLNAAGGGDKRHIKDMTTESVRHHVNTVTWDDDIWQEVVGATGTIQPNTDVGVTLVDLDESDLQLTSEKHVYMDGDDQSVSLHYDPAAGLTGVLMVEGADVAILDEKKLGVGVIPLAGAISTFEGTLKIKEVAAPGVDTAAYGQLWVKSDTPNKLYFTDDAGTDHEIAFV